MGKKAILVQMMLQSVTSAAFAGGLFSEGPIYFNGSIPLQAQSAVLASGPNQFTPPASAVGVIVIPPPTNATAITAYGSIGSGGTVTLTVGSTIVTAVAIGTAGSGYPVSRTLLAAPIQSGGSGCFFNVLTNSSGVPSTMVFPTGSGGTGYVAATVPWIIADVGLDIPPATPWFHVFNTGRPPANFILWASAATSGQTQVLFF